MAPFEGASRADDASERLMTARRRFFTVWALVGAGLLMVAGAYVLNLLAMPLGIVLWTIVIVFLLREPVARFERWGIPRLYGTGLAYVLLFALLGLVSYVIFSPQIGVGVQFRELLDAVPGYVRSLTSLFNDLYARYSDYLQDETVRRWVNSAADSLLSFTSGLAGSSATTLFAAGTSIANVFVTVGFALVIAFWMLIDLPRLGAEVRRLFGPRYADDLRMLHASATRVMGGYIVGTVVQCTIIGVCCGVLFTLLGVEGPAALGVICGLMNIIPIVGPWIGGVLAAVMTLFNSPILALAALLGTIVVQQLVYTFVSPRIMSNAVDIHPALTFLVLLAGSAVGNLMGGLMGALVGALLSIPVVAMAKSVFVYYFERGTHRRIVSPEGVFFKGAETTDDAFDPLMDATGAKSARAAARRAHGERSAGHATAGTPPADDGEGSRASTEPDGSTD
ncbi:AI-2E family transporter [Eggerthellaceae bacterium zg-1084]|uniref:AI-2E family transporter n=1 Tax=Berryella wangjianweii TaxID=2734634 RepID=A0A6M8J5N7_9ACTN|nr:AI-2E family transporter [Berryella wangjianweii]NPD30638.1 AI-2E family transporter [Berryella wangjianweii]NPD32144.1 AI-2E family transporter [Eggerthellaceae bacterium zg-997]QKF07286.1 AI-2E family transporter [Berryella wangjianweii]